MDWLRIKDADIAVVEALHDALYDREIFPKGCEFYSKAKVLINKLYNIIERDKKCYVKFIPNQTVYFLNRNGIIKSEVRFIAINEDGIKYTISNNEQMYEHNLFESEEEIKKYINNLKPKEI